MKFRLFILLSAFFFPSLVFAAGGDLALPLENLKFSTNTFLEGKNIRIYATVESKSEGDLRGVVKFFDGKEQIRGDQPVSVLAGRDDSVFVDWTAEAGDHTLKALLVPFENDDDDPNNNYTEKTITVFSDTDRDGVPNKDDPDDDNDATPDTADAFPLNKNESLDTDGDSLGNNKDDDDDNDGVKDIDDALPLNTNESIDTDKDGIGNNEDLDDDGDGVSDVDEVKNKTDPLKTDSDGDNVNDKEDAYPLDFTQARDFDRDGVGDAKDSDADNDGIPKTKDVNDTNLGPTIIITSDEKPARHIVFPSELIVFETTTSTDPDGKVAKTEWNKGGKKTSGQQFETTFQKPGFHTIEVTVTDDKNESRTTTLNIFVVPPWAPWFVIALLLLIFILAIFFAFSYSKRRRSKWERVHGILDTLLKWLPDPKKK